MKEKTLFTEFIVFEEETERVIFEIKDNRMVSFSVENKKGHSVGDIIIGKVTNVVKNIQGIFLKIDADTSCFMSLEDCKTPIILNRDFDGQIKENDEIVVQIKKEAHKKKLACVGTEPELVSDLFVIRKETGLGRNYSFSKKLSVDKKKEIAEEISHLDDLLLNNHILFRTECEMVAADVIIKALKEKIVSFENILLKAKHSYPYTVLYKKDGILESEMKRSISEGACKWITEDKNLYKEMLYLAEKYNYDSGDIVLYDNEDLPLPVLYGLGNKLKNISEEKIWLKSGGSLYITPTEALTVIDVNSGKCLDKGDKEETYLKINSEAASEIAFQIGARNLSGIILVDFINLKEEFHRTILLDALKQKLSGLKPAGNVVDITKLGIIEIVRKKEKADIYEYKQILDKTILMSSQKKSSF